MFGGLKKIFLFLLIAVSLSGFVYAVECGSTPTDGCVVTQYTTFNPGNYYLPNGITINAKYVTLDCQGATLIGSGSGKGIKIDDWERTDYETIKNCKNNIM